MFYDLVPEELQNDLDALLNDLSYLPEQVKECCPFCHHLDFYKIRHKPLIFRCKACQKYLNPLTKTPFNRLTPPIWLGLILTRRIEKATYQTLAHELDCSIEMVKRRDHALIAYMEEQYPAFHLWYTQIRIQSSQILPILIDQQHKEMTHIIRGLLTREGIPCRYCQSTETVRIGQRAGLRCKRCKKTFNLLDKTPLNKMTHAELWSSFIDRLVNNQTNKIIADDLRLSHSTVSKWRNAWCEMMKKWNYEALAVWCNKKH